MKKFIVRRDVPGVGAVSRRDWTERAARTNELIAKELSPELQWVESQIGADRAYCIYFATSADVVRRHSELAGIPGAFDRRDHNGRRAQRRSRRNRDGQSPDACDLRRRRRLFRTRHLWGSGRVPDDERSTPSIRREEHECSMSAAEPVHRPCPLRNALGRTGMSSEWTSQHPSSFSRARKRPQANSTTSNFESLT